MRPQSWRNQTQEKRCENCRHAKIPEHQDCLLCFYGDNIVAQPSVLKEYWDDVLLDGKRVGLMDGTEYDAVCGSREVDDTDVCDKWEET